MPEKVLKKKKKFDYIDVIANVFMVLFSICILYPMLNVVATSFSGAGAITRNEVTIFPVDFTLDSFLHFAEQPKFLRGFFVGVQYTVEGIIANLLATALMAYPLSKSRLLGRSLIMKLCVFPMYFQAGIIPMYMLVSNLGLYDTEWAWIISNLIGTTNMIIVINGYRAIPESLYEAAYLDGASEFQVFWKIALPLSKATLASVGLFYFMNHWNQWYAPMIYLRTPDKYPLQLLMRQVLIPESGAQEDFNQNLTPTGVKNALIVMSMIPVLLVYPFVQKYFVKGVMIGSVKG